MSGGDASLSAYVRTLVGSPSLAADIVQETRVRAIPSLREGRVENVRALLYRVARNLVVDGARDRSKWSSWVLDEDLGLLIADDTPSAERAALARDRLQVVLEPVESLPPRCREVFGLRKMDGLRQADIAERLGITRNVAFAVKYGF
ncbi:MAG: RNA polymerase sigma factor [Novosphingobium sp.]